MKLLKALIFCTVVCVLASALILPVSAAPNNFGGDFGGNNGTTGIYGGVLTYRIGRNGTASITKCSSSATGNIEIPSVIEDAPVTSIGDYAFQHCTGITGISIPEGVTGLGYSAFYGCTALETINIPSTVDTIEYAAFYKCSALKSADIADLLAWCNTSIDGEYATPAHILGQLTVNGQAVTSITVPDSVTKISDYAFYGCKTLTSVTLPEGLVEIGECAFYGCEGLTSVSVPKNVTVIGDGAFSACKSLTSLDIADGNTKYSNVDGNLIELSSKTLILGVDSGVIPSDGSVVRLGGYAFSACSATSVTVPDCIVAIGSSAYKDCKQLTSVTVPDSVTVIRSGVFSGCEKLTTVTLPDTVTLIGVSAFRDCSSLEALNLPKSLETIKDYAFANCVALRSFKLPAAVKEIGEGILDGCGNISRIEVVSGNTRYGNSDNCLIDYRNGILLRGTGFGTVPIDGSIKKIGYYAFSGCDNMTQVTIPASVSEIGINAFDGCSNLQKVYYGQDKAAWDKLKMLEGNEALDSAEILYNNVDMPKLKAEDIFDDAPINDGDDDGDGNGADYWLWIAIGGGALLLAAAVVIFAVVRKKKA